MERTSAREEDVPNKALRIYALNELDGHRIFPGFPSLGALLFVIIFVGVASAFLLLPPNQVVRSDGTIVKLQAASRPHEELVGMWHTLKDWRIIGRSRPPPAPAH